MKEAIRDRARELGFDDCRFTTASTPESGAHFQNWLAKGRQGGMTYLLKNAHKRMDPQKVLPGAQSIVALAVSYENKGSTGHRARKAYRFSGRQSDGYTGALEHSAGTFDISGGKAHTGVIARYARYGDYHDVIAERLRTLVDFVAHIGGRDTRSLWYVDTGPLLERDLAQRAGLGFIGKHTNLISRGLGNWIFLSEIITTLRLEPDAPEQNRCGCCRRCLDACPTGAIRAPFQLDARLCISYLTIELKGSIPLELREAIGNRIYGCDDCLAVCPWNRFARSSQLMSEHLRLDLEEPDLIELLSLTDAQFKERFAGTPIMRAKRKGLLRNVCVALGNTGHSTALPALRKAAQDPEPLIAEHARWAIERILAKTALTVETAHG
jgi:epoxyqueuosine reductase